jgi:signal peptidase I
MNTFFSHFGTDFASILFVLSIVSGVLWALDKWRLEPGRKALAAASGSEVAKASWLVDLGRQFFPVIAAVFVLRSFVVEPFRIPSGSMIPTLRIGDFILVNRFAYGLRCPVGDCKLLALGEPKHGDVVVFRYPVDPRQDFIKRVIGLPGDTVRYVDKVLTVNGVRAEQQPQGDFEHTPVTLARENYFGVEHNVLANPDRPARDFEYTVPEGQYFMMGDNRDGSSDSRYWGTVPEANLKGRAFFIWMSWNADALQPVWSRIGGIIR